MLKPKSFLAAVVLLVSAFASAQSPDTLFVSVARRNSLKTFETATVVQSGLFSGSQYNEPRRTNDEHPFFLSEQWLEGNVYYKGQVYENIALLYDITTDRLVSELFNGQPFALVTEHLVKFTVAGHRFVRIDNASVGNSLPASGFYELAYDGPTRTITRHVKVQEERIENNTIQINYEPKTRYYILVKGNYIRITSKGSLLKALVDHKTEVRSFLQRNKSSFKSPGLPATLAAVAAYYDTLTPTTKP